jgi:glycosyltransferase involved in cell wall biosynthesis
MVRAVATIVREARRHSADLIHAFWAHEPGAVAIAAGRLTGLPAIVTVMGGELVALPQIGYGGQLRMANRTLARFSLAGARRVIVLCSAAAEQAAARVGTRRLRRIDWGVSSSRFHPNAAIKPPAEGIFRFLAVGSLVPVKGYATILEAFAQCHAQVPGAQLEIVGGGELGDDLRRKVVELGIDGAVHFAGEVEHSHLPPHYQRADAMVVGSLWEGGSPQVVLEALACGLPIAGTAVGLLPELDAAAECVPVGDAPALGAAMARVATDSHLREEMRSATRRAKRRIELCVAEHERLYDSLHRRSVHGHDHHQ